MIKGKIASIMDPNTVILTVGREHNVKLGMNFLIYEDVIVNDPDTNELLEVFPYRKGVVKVVQVNKKTSIAISNEVSSTLNSLGKLIRFLSNENEQEKFVNSIFYQEEILPLNIDKNYLKDHIKSKQICIGDLVVYIDENPQKYLSTSPVKLLPKPTEEIKIMSMETGFVFESLNNDYKIEVDHNSQMVYVIIYGKFQYSKDQIVGEFTVSLPLITWLELCKNQNDLSLEDIKKEVFTDAYIGKWEKQTTEKLDNNLFKFIKSALMNYPTDSTNSIDT